MKILIVGAGLVAYGCAYAILQDGHNVHVADHSIEFGLPNMWPSVLVKRNSIPLSFSTDQQFEGSNNSFRHEWIMKGMSIELANLGAKFFNRTRIDTSTRLESGVYSVDLIGAGQKNGIVEYDRVIDTTQDTWIPWAKSHNISDVSNTYHVERKSQQPDMSIFNQTQTSLTIQFIKSTDTMVFQNLGIEENTQQQIVRSSKSFQRCYR